MASGALFSVDFTSAELEAALKPFLERGGNLLPAMDIVAASLVTAVGDMFETSGHGTWKALAPSTLARRRGDGSSNKPLYDTTILATSVHGESGSDYAEASTGEDYIKYHLDGGPIIPRRNPFDVPDSVMDEAAETIVNYILGQS